jgi:hypothetical protein
MLTFIGGSASTSSSPVLFQGEESTADGTSAASTPAEGGSLPNSYFAGQHHHGHTSTRSLPTTSRNISFNNKVQFFDVHSPTEYDRRGEIATCNRLTPMLAQQIKEELNSFKMVSSFFSRFIVLTGLLTMSFRRWKFTKIPNHTPTFSNDMTMHLAVYYSS